jgi:hypothetical protein
VIFPGPALNTGYLLGKAGMQTANGSAPTPIRLPGLDLANATDAVLTLNTWFFGAGDSLKVRFNGRAWHTFNHPFPTSDLGARALAIPVPLSDLQTGTNTLEIGSASGTVIMANADLTINVSK